MASGPLARTAGAGLEGSLPSLSPTTTASIPRELLLVALQRARLLAGHQFEVQLQLGNQALRVEVRGGEWTAVQERIPATVTGPEVSAVVAGNGLLAYLERAKSSRIRLQVEAPDRPVLWLADPDTQLWQATQASGALMEESPATTPHPGTSQPVGQTPRWPRAVLDPP